MTTSLRSPPPAPARLAARRPQRTRCAASEPPSLQRRTLLAGSALLPGLTALQAGAAPGLDNIGLHVVLTGANSGIGFDAARKLAERGYTVTLACRTLAKAEAAAELLRAGNVWGTLVPAECDLADLSSIRRFAASVKQPVHVLALNAGLQWSGEQVVHRTVDGFEESVGVNHLGHFLLANLLLPVLEETAKTAPRRPRIVVTASEVHDPAKAGGAVGAPAGLGDFAGVKREGARFELFDGSAFIADKAYKDSKLMNLLFTRTLDRRLRAAGSPVDVLAFGPGLITRTGFFRNQPAIFTALFDFATNDVFRVAETVSGGGDCLVRMATDSALDGRSGEYWNNDIDSEHFGRHVFGVGQPSAEALSDAEGEELWDISARLTGLAA